MFLILLNTELLVPGTKINIQFVNVMSSIVEKFTSSYVVLIVHSVKVLKEERYAFHGYLNLIKHTDKK
jgi:hypothetical protein